jgi:hypothetical protein
LARQRLFLPNQVPDTCPWIAAERREALPPSILVLTTEGQILTRSSAVLHFLDRLGGGWQVMAVVGRMIPAGVRILGTGSSLVCGMGFCPRRTRRALLWRPSCAQGLGLKKTQENTDRAWLSPRLLTHAGSGESTLGD